MRYKFYIKIIILVVLLIRYLSASSQNCTVDTNLVNTAEYHQLLQANDSLMYFENEKTPYTGKCISNTSTGKLSRKIFYKDGREICNIEYFENGNKKSVNFYNVHINVCISTYWYINGTKKQEIEYSNGIETRIEGWHENGSNKSVQLFKDAKKNGIWREWYDTGKKKLEGTYENNARVGTWTKWFPNGEIEKERVFTK